MTAFGPLLAKDLRVLVRSRLLLGVLVAYPLLLAGLVAVVSREAGARPRVAYVDAARVPAVIEVGGTKVRYADELKRVRERVQLVAMSGRQAERALADGSVVATIGIPRGFASDVASTLRSPAVVLRTRSGALGDRAVREVEAFVYDLNRRISAELLRENVDYLRVIVNGGSTVFLGRTVEILGLRETARIVADQRTHAAGADRDALGRILDFAHDATLALTFAGPSLRATAHPIVLDEHTAGGAELLSNRGIAVVVGVGLALVGILLGAGSVASERDENAIGRLVRGRVRLSVLIAEKIALVALVGLVLGAAVVCLYAVVAAVAGDGSGPSVGRIAIAVPLLAVAGAAVGAAGVLVGVVVRELAAAALVALLVTLPFLLAGLLPRGAAPTLDSISAAFPFTPAADALAAILYDPGPGRALTTGCLHLAGLGAVYAAGARALAHRLAR